MNYKVSHLSVVLPVNWSGTYHSSTYFTGFLWEINELISLAQFRTVPNTVNLQYMLAIITWLVTILFHAAYVS